ncbi:hypothetical protein [Methylobacterium sp. MA0201]
MIRAAILSAALMSEIPDQAIASAWDNVPRRGGLNGIETRAPRSVRRTPY